MSNASCADCLLSAPAFGWCASSSQCVLLGAPATACASVVVGGADVCPREYTTSPLLVIIQSVCGLCLLLGFGHVVRANVRLMRTFFMPASLIGGLFGLLVLQLCYLSPSVKEYMQAQWVVGWNELPGFLITVVLCALFLGVRIPGPKETWRLAGPQLMFGQIIAWGQYAWPALLTATVLVPVYGSSPYIAVIIALGYEGGHGTSAGMKQTFDALGYPEGTQLALATSTVGLIAGVLIGTLLVNYAAYRGVVEQVSYTTVGMHTTYDFTERPIGMHITVLPEAIDTLGLHLSLVGFALTIGYMLKQMLIAIEGTSAWLTQYQLFTAFPMFPLCMLGGIITERLLRLVTKRSPIDKGCLDRIAGTAMEFLTVAAIADMRIESVVSNIIPFVLLCIVGLVWTVGCFFAAPYLLPDHWAERAITDIGQSLGTTATGFMLLRMMDPLYKTPVMLAFSYKQMIHEPLVGGGIWTALALPIISIAGLWTVFGISLGFIVFWLLMYAFYFRPMYARMDYTQIKDAEPADDSSALVGVASDLDASIQSSTKMA